MALFMFLLDTLISDCGKMPDAFSPNGDGLHEYFGIVDFNQQVELLSFKVYNRWGQMIHNKVDDSGASYLNMLQAQDVYSQCNQKSILTSSTFTLIS